MESNQKFYEESKLASSDISNMGDDRNSEDYQGSYSSEKSEEIKIMKLKYKQSQNKVYHDFYKTKMCPLYLLSICMKGNECPFAHSEEELREKPNLVKTKLCEAYLQGCCKYGDQCNFAHGENELRSTPDLFKTAICNLWSQGKCQAGERCRFAHGYDDLRPAPLHHKVKKNQYNQMINNETKAAYVEPVTMIPQYQPNYLAVPVYNNFPYYAQQQFSPPVNGNSGLGGNNYSTQDYAVEGYNVNGGIQGSFLPSFQSVASSTVTKAKFMNTINQGKGRRRVLG